ncbi:MAG: hypothetical protein JXR41_01170 [Bacteroidales bacterium]|nr:hypothetical protein [Bacteroidales bacterium]MBN2761670.1 hypothetical protein [Bacteroidales bacterium]
MLKIRYLPLHCLIILFISCSESGTDVPIEKKIYTMIDRYSYLQTDTLFFSVRNLTDSSAYFLVCSGYPKPIPDIEKYKDGQWSVYRSPVCDGFMTYCCKEFPMLESIADTIHWYDLEKGKYRLRFRFSVFNENHQYIDSESVSKEFMVE